jgi:hypothetical protein
LNLLNAQFLNLPPEPEVSMTKLLFFLSLLFLSACLKITDIPEDAPQIPQAEVVGLADPNHYMVRLPFPDGAQVAQRYEKANEGANERALVSLPLKLAEGTFMDDQVLAGHHYVYQLGHAKDGNFELIHSFEVQIPTDLSIQEELTLQKDEMWTQYGRIFIGPQGILTTNGHQLFIQTNQLISNQGQIRTLVSGENTAVSSNGLSGGHIQIFLRSGSGALKIFLRGQNGGAGQAGATLPPDPPIQPIIIPIGSGGLSNMSTGGARFTLKTKPGGNAGNGGRGGNSGRLQISISENHDLVLHPTVIEGQGGSAGIGGAPQPIGGWTDELGEKGADGRAGENGVREALCLRDLKGQTCW